MPGQHTAASLRAAPSSVITTPRGGKGAEKFEGQKVRPAARQGVLTNEAQRTKALFFKLIER